MQTSSQRNEDHEAALRASPSAAAKHPTHRDLVVATIIGLIGDVILWLGPMMMLSASLVRLPPRSLGSRHEKAKRQCLRRATKHVTAAFETRALLHTNCEGILGEAIFSPTTDTRLVPLPQRPHQSPLSLDRGAAKWVSWAAQTDPAVGGPRARMSAVAMWWPALEELAKSNGELCLGTNSCGSGRHHQRGPMVYIRNTRLEEPFSRTAKGP